jgi:hypothetical protein
MTSLLSAFAQSMTPDAIGKLGEAVGLNATHTEKGLAVLGPLVLGSLARKSEAAGGFDAVMELLPEDGGGWTLGRLLGSDDSSPALLTRLWGPGVSSIAKVISSRLGFDVSGLAMTAVPALLRVISTTIKEQNVGASEIATLLKTQSAESLERATPETRAVLHEAFEVGEQAQRRRDTFDPNEWRAIRLSPSAVAHYVVTASPSGLGAMATELLTAADATADLVKAAPASSLIDIAFGSALDAQELGSQGGLDPAEAPRDTLLAIVQTASAAVRAKMPDDAKAYGQALVALSRRVAEAAKEGGILGIGGTQVSKEEEQAIAEITTALEGGLASAAPA